MRSNDSADVADLESSDHNKILLSANIVCEFLASDDSPDATLLAPSTIVGPSNPAASNRTQGSKQSSKGRSSGRAWQNHAGKVVYNFWPRTEDDEKLMMDDDSDDADAQQMLINLQEKKDPLEDDACTPERKGNNGADEKEEAQARESERRGIGGTSNDALNKHGKQKSTQGSDATAPKTPEQGQVTEQGNTKDAAKAKVSSVAESPELQESFQKGAAKEAGKAAQQSARVSSRTVTQDGGSKKQCAKEVQAAQASKSRGRGRGSGPLQGPWLTSSCLTQQSYNLQGASQASICCLVWWALDASVFQALEICNLYDLSVHQLHTQLHT
ncbi:TPA: hypothetical protein ACH3X2_002505 [Trebouxia sp. C0005]